MVFPVFIGGRSKGGSEGGGRVVKIERDIAMQNIVNTG